LSVCLSVCHNDNDIIVSSADPVLSVTSPAAMLAVVIAIL